MYYIPSHGNITRERLYRRYRIILGIRQAVYGCARKYARWLELCDFGGIHYPYND